MDPLSTTLGVLGLVGIFGTCMDGIDAMQLGRHFGEDYGKCILRLDSVKLRLMRWGASAAMIAPNEVAHAEALLEQIVECLKKARAFSETYEKDKQRRGEAADLVVFEPEAALRTDQSRLHATLGRLIRGHKRVAVANECRQNDASLLSKTRWALYDKKKFDQLIEEITDFVNQLTDLFPAATRERQAELCRKEASTIASTNLQDLQLIKGVVDETDAQLREAVHEETVRRGNYVTDWTVGENANVRVGDNVPFGVRGANNTARKFNVTGGATVWIGNNNLGR